MAATFGHRHDDVLRRSAPHAIARLIFEPCNFAGSKYEGENGRELPCFEMTRDGFTRLVMSFTGATAYFRLAIGFSRIKASTSVNISDNRQL